MGVVVEGSFVSDVIRKLLHIVGDAITNGGFDELEPTEDLLFASRLNLPSMYTALQFASCSLDVDPRLSELLTQLKNIVYEADDFLDELDYHRIKMRSSSLDVTKWLRSDCRFDNLIVLVRSLHELSQNISAYSDVKIQREPTSTSLMDEDERQIFLGRDKDKDFIFHAFRDFQQASTSDSSAKTITLPIFGFGGIGKTALAKQVYNDIKFRKNFDLVAWVPAFEIRQAKQTILDIISHFGGAGIDSSKSLTVIADRLVDIISGRRFLLVLDGVTQISNSKWNYIQQVLNKGRGAVLVTTQSEEIARYMGSVTPIRLDVLSEIDYLRLLSYHAFGNQETLMDENNHDRIKKAVFGKLYGLPLAGKVIGQLLRANMNQKFLRELAGCAWWENKHIFSKILPSLSLSYRYLDTHLQQCFAYCSVFPNGFLFEKDQIIEMWIAQGYVESNPHQRDEDIGTEYFDDLLQKSFFLTEHGGYVMHDFMVDLANIVSGDECYVISNGRPLRSSDTIRHLSVGFYDSEVAKFVAECKRLRTLLFRGIHFQPITGRELDAMFENLKGLRVIDLSRFNLRELNMPVSVGNLIHLRYLDLQKKGKLLPVNFFCNLYHVQVLYLIGCYTDSPLHGFDNLICLRHLHAEEEFLEMISTDKLTNLQELPVFNARRSKMFELGNLNQLHGSLSISGLENVNSKQEAISANIKKKKFVTNLSMHSSCAILREEREMFEGLQPHKDIRVIEVNGYCDFTLPKWLVEIQDLSRLHFVCLQNFKRLQNLPPLGLLRFLQHLKLAYLESITSIGADFYGSSRGEAFPRLEVLELLNLQKLKKWMECSTSDFKSLRKLQICDCDVLENYLPLSHGEDMSEDEKLQSFANLQKITILRCPMLIPALLDLPSLNRVKTDDSLLSIDFVPSSSFSSLETLNIVHANIFVFSQEQEKWFEQLVSLKVLEIISCPNLYSLPMRLSNLSLRKLTLMDCPMIQCLPEISLPRSLEYLSLVRCSNLSRLPSNLVNLPLRSLWIISCHLISSLPEKGLPSTLEELNLRGSLKLQESCFYSEAGYEGEIAAAIRHISRIRF